MGLFNNKSIEELKEEAELLKLKIYEKRERKELENFIKQAKKEISPMNEVKQVTNKFLDSISLNKGGKNGSNKVFSSPLMDKAEGKTLSPILDDLLDNK